MKITLTLSKRDPRIVPGVVAASAVSLTLVNALQGLPGTSGATNLAIGTISASTVQITSDTGTAATIPAATASAAGVATAAQVTKLDGIAAGAEVNVNADWNAVSGDAQILNKPTIPAAQVNSDWTAVSGLAQILNKPTLATVATTGAYADLSGKPTLGTAAALNVPAAGDAASGEVVKGSDTRLTDSRAPTAHTHPLSDLTQSGATSGQIPSWNGAAWVPIAAPSGTTNLAQGTRTATTVPVTSSTGSSATLTAADASNAGVMIAADKVKLDAITGTNTGDQTSIVGITGTKAQFDTALTDGNFAYSGDAPTAHTHTASEVTDFNSASRAQTEAELVAGTNITITPGSSGATRTLTIAASGAAASNLALGTTTATTQPITNSNGTGFTLPEATISLAGLLNATDKTKLTNTSGTNTGDQNLSGLQPLDTGLTSLAGLTGVGYIKETATDVFSVVATIPSTDISGLGTLATQSGTFSGSSSGTNTGDQDLSALALKATTISAGTGLSGGGDLSANRTLNLANTAVSPGSYTAADITVDAQGRITAAANGSGAAASNLALGTTTATTQPITNSNGTGFTLPEATISLAGLLNATDKTKLTNTSGTNTGDQNLSGLQPLDTGLTSLAGLTGVGYIKETATDVFSVVATIPSTDISGLGTLATQSGTFSGTHSGTSSGTNTGDQDLSALALKTTTISAGTGLSGGGDLSANRTLTLANTAVSPGSYTAADITVDAQGRITAAANGSGGGATNLALGTVTATTQPITNSNGTGFTLPAATATDAGLLVAADKVKLDKLQATGADIASATTTDIGAATGESVNITGTTTITGLGTVAAGTKRSVIFSGALILTHNATSLILPTAANITTAAGDTAEFLSLGSGNWKCLRFDKTSGAALVGGSTAPQTDTFTASGTWTKPAGAVRCDIAVMCGGGGGGSGRRGASGTNRSGGGGGGAGAVMIAFGVDASALASTGTVTVGAGGAGGAARTADSTNGANGSAGGASSFVSNGMTIAYSGSAANSSGGGGNSGGGGTSSGAGTGGAAIPFGNNECVVTSCTNGGNAVSPSAVSGGLGISGGGGGGAGNISGSNVDIAGSQGGGVIRGTGTRGTAGAAGTNNGGNASDSTTIVSAAGIQGGPGGGGGGGSANDAGGNGGNGIRGGGGGGGGASTNGSNSGAGGNGGDGLVIITTYFS